MMPILLKWREVFQIGKLWNIGTENQISTVNFLNLKVKSVIKYF